MSSLQHFDQTPLDARKGNMKTLPTRGGEFVHRRSIEVFYVNSSISETCRPERREGNRADVVVDIRRSVGVLKDVLSVIGGAVVGDNASWTEYDIVQRQLKRHRL